MTNTPPLPPTKQAHNDFAGDVLARSGHWQSAVSSWVTELDGQDSVHAESRLRWFLETTIGNVDPALPRWRTALPEPFLTGVAAAFIGTAAVLIGETVSSPWNHALGASAWLLYALAAVCGLIYAKRHGPSTPIKLTPEVLAIVHQQASLIDSGSATIHEGPTQRV